MNIQTFLMECFMRGFDIKAVGENLHVTPKAKLKPATADFIRKHKAAIIKQLNSEHGPCIQCGIDTRNMLTRPDGSISWTCSQCFESDPARPARYKQRKQA